ncbi:MAG: hypothetical protein HRU03_07295 [Nanoarchaeales archaeon]|nr:hypothetical protein [Nanoarchaeales archaeon]
MIGDRIKLSNGKFFFDDSQIYTAPMNSILLFHDYLFKIVGSETYEHLVTKAFYPDTKITYDKLREQTKDPKILIQKFLDKINYFGYGEFYLLNLNENKIIISHKIYYLNHIFKKVFNSNCDVSPIVSVTSYLKNFISLVYGYEFDLNTIEKGPGLTFVLKKTNKKFNLDEFSNYKYPKYEKGNISPGAKHLILNGSFKVENGQFKISGVNTCILPYFFLFEFYKFFLENEKVRELISSIGYAQGKVLIDMCMLFGIKKGKDTFITTMNMTDLWGFGRFNFNINDLTNIKYEESNFEYYNQFYSKEVIDVFLNNILEIFQNIDEKYFFSFFRM